ncbi:MAG: response regulator [Chthoniobacterales bacterium]
MVQRKAILVVDDEAIALKYFARAFDDRFPVYSVGSAAEALDLLNLRHESIGVVVTDQRMPDASGIDLLTTVRDRFPSIVRILTTAYTEQRLLVDAINSGAVYAFVTKPWELNELENVLDNAVELHERQANDAQLMATKFDELRAKIFDDRIQDVGMVSAKIGHYIHNALCPLTFVIEQLIEHSPDTPDLPLDFVLSTRDHLYDVAQTLKDLEQAGTRVSPSELEWIDLAEVASQALKDTVVIRSQKKLKFVREIDPETPKILGSPKQLAKVFRFMIAEEIVSLPESSEVRLFIEPEVVDGEVIGAAIYFEDSVPVSSETTPESLLHPFNLRGSNPREFGVFLVSCYLIVKHHGGSINAWINEDDGLSISLFLPCEPDNSDEPDFLFQKTPAKPETPRNSP